MIIVELRRMHMRPSTAWILAGALAIPILLVLGLRFADASVTFAERILVDTATESGLDFTRYGLLAFSQTGMLLLVAYLFGETVAREAEWGTLSTTLAAPVDRTVLLVRKAAACAVVWIAATVLYTAATLTAGVIAFGSGELSGGSGDPVSMGPALLRVLGAVGYLVVANLWLVALAMLISVRADGNTLAAVAATAAIGLASHVAGALPILDPVRAVLPTRNYDAWRGLMRADIHASGMVWGVFLSLTYTVVFAVAAALTFARRSIPN